MKPYAQHKLYIRRNLKTKMMKIDMENELLILLIQSRLIMNRLLTVSYFNAVYYRIFLMNIKHNDTPERHLDKLSEALVTISE